MILYRRSRGLAALHSVVQTALAGGAYLCWLALPWELTIAESAFGLPNYLLYGVMVALGVILDTLRMLSIQDSLVRMPLWKVVRRTARQVATVAFTVAMFLFLIHDIAVSRVFLCSYLLVLSLVLLLTNRYLPAWLSWLFFSNSHRRTTLVVGHDGSRAIEREWTMEKKDYGMDVVGTLISDDVEAVENAVIEHNAQQLLLLSMPTHMGALETYVRLCQRHGIRLLVLNDWSARLGQPLHLEYDNGQQYFTFSRAMLECPLNRVLKRVFDLAIAIPACLLIVPPAALLVWFLHRTQSPGPIFFRQRRTGANGRDFWLYKFRSMHVSNPDEALQASVNDPRVFEAGRWLRKLSLDELPQFINVVQGDMSIVGPRPHMKAHDDRFAELSTAYRMRHHVKPGITGLAQVTGWRGETKTVEDVVKRTEADLNYAENWSLLMDTSIVLKTIVQVIKPLRSAY